MLQGLVWMKHRLSLLPRLLIEQILILYGQSDHTNVPQWKNAVVNDAWLMLAAIGAVTNKVELGACVTDAIRRHPSTIALSTVTLDRITKGRGILGIGAGEAQNVIDFGIEFSKPVTKFKEQLEVIEKLFDSNPDNKVNCDGKYYKLIEACLQETNQKAKAACIYCSRCSENPGVMRNFW